MKITSLSWSRAGAPLAAIISLFFSCGPSHHNRALAFDGVDDFIELGNIYDDLAFPVSIAVWVYMENTHGYALPIFDSQDDFTDAHNGVTLAVMGDASDVVIGYGDGRGHNKPTYRRSKSVHTTNITGRWVYLAANMRGPDDMDVFIDGVDAGGVYDGDSHEPIASDFPDDIANIGTWTSHEKTFRFRGKLDELSLWNRSLTAAEIQTNMHKKLTGKEPGLIGYWPFDEAEGNAIKDLSPFQYHGVIKGNPERVRGAF